MDATLYTGTGSSLAVVNAAGFKPDLVYIANRVNAKNKPIFDSVRGVNQYLYTNSTSADLNIGGGLTAFNSNGFTVGGNSDTGDTVAMVGWQWQAGQGSTSSNTSGSITSTVSVNTTAGFSVVTYTGNGVANATVGHGLGVQPNLIIVKQRTGTADNWAVSVKLSNLTVNRMYLNSTIADNGTDWVGASSTLLTLKLSDNFVNANGNTYVSYCWASINGFSKIGSYTGNGSADGPFVFTGFRPKWIMIKRTDSTSNWVMFDTSRSTYNLQQADLYANLSDAEATNAIIPDILSNGFKVRTSNATWNTNGGTWIYAAFAENPFKNANAR
jgi:hypothetical protein